MKRRDFIKKAGVATAAASFSPLMFASAQRSTYRWGMVTSWPTGLDALFGAAQDTADVLSELTDGDVQVEVHAAGAQVGAFEVYDAAASGAFEMAHSAPYYFINKNPTHGFFTAVPFGMTAEQYDAWMFEGEGQSMLDELTRPDGLAAFVAGNTGPQTSGWFNREINSPEDLRGLTIRFPGFGGQVLSAVGANVQNLPGGEIFLALDTGVVDAADWVGPYDDEILQLNQVARYYYFPSWAEPGAALAAYINLDLFESLPADIQEAVQAAGHVANERMLAKYAARNGAALDRLIAGGTEIRFLSESILETLEGATNEIHEQNASGNDLYRRTLDSYNAFLGTVRGWERVSTHAYNDYIFRNQ